MTTARITTSDFRFLARFELSLNFDSPLPGLKMSAQDNPSQSDAADEEELDDWQVLQTVDSRHRSG
jgi:hypothetical protein